MIVGHDFSEEPAAAALAAAVTGASEVRPPKYYGGNCRLGPVYTRCTTTHCHRKKFKHFPKCRSTFEKCVAGTRY